MWARDARGYTESPCKVRDTPHNVTHTVQSLYDQSACSAHTVALEMQKSKCFSYFFCEVLCFCLFLGFCFGVFSLTASRSRCERSRGRFACESGPTGGGAASCVGVTRAAS
jgi:hypothetical protein